MELAYIPVSSRSSSGNLGTTVKNNYNSNTAAGYDTAAEGRQRIRSSPFSAWITADAGPSRIPAGNRLGKRDPASRGKEGGRHGQQQSCLAPFVAPVTPPVGVTSEAISRASLATQSAAAITAAERTNPKMKL